MHDLRGSVDTSGRNEATVHTEGGWWARASKSGDPGRPAEVAGPLTGPGGVSAGYLPAADRPGGGPGATGGRAASEAEVISDADATIRQIYAIGLQLAACRTMTAGPLADKLGVAIDALDALIRVVRTQAIDRLAAPAPPTPPPDLLLS